jgi:hypothetical protein
LIFIKCNLNIYFFSLVQSWLAHFKLNLFCMTTTKRNPIYILWSHYYTYVLYLFICLKHVLLLHIFHYLFIYKISIITKSVSQMKITVKCANHDWTSEKKYIFRLHFIKINILIKKKQQGQRKAWHIPLT